ncbi:MAG TPA: hypothetical protein VEU47_10895 [Candidatus Cybelea sp.]|nr:hypothetical protein [Candidatus Cybelea sp.]
MAILPFGEYAPDISSYKTSTSQTILNVVPRADGYGPHQDLLSFTASLPSACRGYFYGRKSDGSVQLFAGTATDLYILNNSVFTWTKVSRGGGPYGSLSADSNWQFAQFGDIIFATQQNEPLQAYAMSSSSVFANQAGSPPQAAYIAIVGQFVVLSGLLSTRYRITWCGLNDPTNWVAGVNQSDFQDFADGGIVRGVAGGEYGVVFQDTAIRSMVYAPGSPVIFTITRVADDVGLFAPYGIVRAGDKVYFPSTKGFQVIEAGNLPQAIGKERVDRTFFGNVDQSNMQLCIGFADPTSTRVGWAFKSINGGFAGSFDTILLYDFELERWVEIASIVGEYIASLAKPGVTLEGLDLIAPGGITITNITNAGGFCALSVASIARNSGPVPPDGAPTETQLQIGDFMSISGVQGTGGLPAAINTENVEITAISGTGPFTITTNIAFTGAYTSGGLIAGSLDAMTQSLDSFPAASLVALSGFNSAHALGFFNGPNLQAVLQTSDQGDDERRLIVQALRPVTDAPSAFASIGARENLQNSLAFAAETAVNAQGLCPQRISTRYPRAQVRIPYGTAWTFIKGVEPTFKLAGKR